MARVKRKAAPARPFDGAAAIRWIERHCYIPKGPAVGKRVKLIDYQREVISGIFDTPTRRAIVSMGRQNAKTTLAAYLLLLHLCGPRHQRNGLLVSSALSRDQAAIIFDHAVKIIRQSPDLRAAVDVVEFQRILRCPELGTVYRALSADAPAQLGISPFFTVHDELGQIVGPFSPLYDNIETGGAAQADPLSVIISTQARSDGDLLSRLIDDAETGADPRTKLFLWTADPEVDPFAEASWRAANPALGHFLQIEEVRQQAESARRMPAMEASFRNLVLNQRCEALSPFVSPSVWRDNGAPPSKLDGARVRGGLDLSAVHDLTSLVLLDQVDGSVHVFAWLPEEGLAEKARLDKVDYIGWVKDGALLTTPGRAISYDYVANFMRDIFRRCNVEKIAFDRWNMRFLRPCLERAGFSEQELAKFVEFGQGFFSFGPAIRELEVRLLEKRLRHGMHPALSAAAVNAKVVTDPAGGRKFDKRKSTGRIDPLTALTQAVGISAEAAAPKPKFQFFALGR